MRVFVAIDPPPEVRRSMLEAAIEASRGFGDEVRWTKPENVHLTLKFLGEVSGEALEGIRDALTVACSPHAPFDARLRGLGAFPSPRRARVIWAGVGEGSGGISSLATSVESALEPWGFRREGRPYVPHATLGRAKGRSVSLDLPANDVPETQIFRVSGVSLTKSTLAPGGPVYETLDAFTLRGTAR